MRALQTIVAVLLLGAGACRRPRAALDRGDELYGAGEAEAAVAEYKLALRRRGEDPQVLLRLGAAYAARGDVEASRRYLTRLMERDSSYRFQVASELAEAARSARKRGALDNMARALEPVEALGLGAVPRDLRLPLARYYAELGNDERALPLYLAVVQAGAEPEPEALFETARTLRNLGGCREAIGYFERYMAADRRDPANLTSARWQAGSCLFEVAEAERRAGAGDDALERLDRLIEIGVPLPLMDRAHFARAELRIARGDTVAAERDLETVLDLNPARSGPLVAQAEEMIREIRYGKP
ncbi:MAG: tetratricopeptide repeat protein [Gemmatimonadota bacterium]